MGFKSGLDIRREMGLLPLSATWVYNPVTTVCSASGEFNFMRSKPNSSPLSAVNTDICLVFLFCFRHRWLPLLKVK